jgi:hypothetical protein
MKARYAPVVPLSVAQWLQGDTKDVDLLGSYHLLLAHDVLEHPAEYKEVYGEVKKRYPGNWIILDNSVVELGSAMPIKELLDAARIIEPKALVIPDVMGDAQGTEDAATEFIRKFREIYPEGELAAGYRLMGVVQGKFMSEVKNCIHYLSDLGIRHFGIPRTVTKYLGTRAGAILYALQSPTLGSIHLLGFSDDVLDDVACCRIPGVSGIDSAVPIRAGLQRFRLTINDIFDYGKRGDYWNTLGKDIDKSPGMVIDNICAIRRWIGETQS